MVRYSDHALHGRSEHDMTNSNGRNIAIVTGSALGLGYELTKRLINNAGQPSFKTPTAYEASDVDRCFKGLKGTSVKVVGVYPGGIDTAFYRDSRDYVSEEKQHTFMDPGELARVILLNLVNDANLTVSDILIERNYR